MKNKFDERMILMKSFRYLENLIDYMDTIADILGQDASYNQVSFTYFKK